MTVPSETSTTIDPREVSLYAGHFDALWGVAWSPDGTRLLSGSHDGTARVWDANRGTELFARWAAEVSAMGGAVSAEHGVGKLKAHFLEEMYGANHIAESARMKAQIDPKGQFGRGNLFSEEVLDAALAELG